MEIVGLVLAALTPILSVLAAAYAERAPARQAQRDREQVELFDENMVARRWSAVSQQLERLLDTVRRHPRQ